MIGQFLARPLYLFHDLPDILQLVIIGVLTASSIYLLLSIVLNTDVSASKRLGISRKKAGPSAGNSKRRSLEDELKRQEERRKSKQADKSILAMIEQANMTILPGQLRLICVGVALFTGLLLLFVGAKLAVVAGVTVGLSLFLPKMYLKRKIKKRQKKFLQDFPEVIDVLVRGVRTGLPVNEGLRVVADQGSGVINQEFSLVSDAVSVGVSLEDALHRLYQRNPVVEVNFFCIVLIIQKSTGGSLAEALGNLSSVIRERKKMAGKIVAMSSEARASAMIVGSLPFLVSTALAFIRPEYISVLITDPTGKMILGGAVGWMLTGIFIMKQMTNVDI